MEHESETEPTVAIDSEDLRELRAAKADEGNAPTMSLKEVQARYGPG